MAAVTACVLLVACSPIRPRHQPLPPVRDMSGTFPVTTGYHVVKPKETLWLIAWMSGWDPKELAKINRLHPPYTLHPGQRIYFSVSQPIQPATRATPSPARIASRTVFSPTEGKQLPWMWPVKPHSTRAITKGSRGILIPGTFGMPIQAAQAGEVVYASNGLKAYGYLVILKHPGGIMSAYAYNHAVRVQVGDRVNRGQVIAQMGYAHDKQARLQFEIRKNASVENPLNYLPTIR